MADSVHLDSSLTAVRNLGASVPLPWCSVLGARCSAGGGAQQALTRPPALAARATSTCTHSGSQLQALLKHKDSSLIDR